VALSASIAYISAVDRLERDDVDRARRSSAQERAGQLIEVIRAGFALKRAALRTRRPEAAQEELDDEFQRWLERSDDR
jgi:hypothetical protein